MRSFLLVFAYSLACMSLGTIGVRSISMGLSKIWREKVQAWECPSSLRFALGVALMSCIWLFLALFEALTKPVLWVVLILFFLPAIKSLPQAVLSVGVAWRGRPPVTDYRDLLFYLLAALALLNAIWFGVLAYVRPPFGDADAFYMTYSKIIGATGALAPMEGWYRDFSTIGLSGELHFAALLVIANTETAKFFAWVVGLGIVALLVNLIRRLGGGFVAQLVTLTMVLTSTTFTDYLSDGKTDLFATLIGLAAVNAALLRNKTASARRSSVVMSGLLTGFAITAKFSFAIALLPVLVTLFVLQHRTPHNDGVAANYAKDSILMTAALFGLAIVVSILPHLLKNQILFDNAFAPFLGMKGNWADQPLWYSSEDTAWIVGTYPFALVFGLYPLMGGTLSFLWLAALPLIFLYIPRATLNFANPAVQLTLAAIVGMLCWVLIKASVFAPRYILTTLLLLIPLPALAIEAVWRAESRPFPISLGFITISLMALASAPLIAPAGVWTALPGNVFEHLKQGRPDCGLAISTYCAGLQAVNAAAQTGERAFVAGYYTYHLRDDLLQCINDPDDFGLLNDTQGANVWEALYQEGFAHIAIQKATHGQYIDKLKRVSPPEWLQVSVDFSDSDMPVYHIRTRTANKKPNVVCAQKGARSWGKLLSTHKVG